MKTYSKHEVAKQIAAALNKKLDEGEHPKEVHAHKGGFVILTDQEFAALKSQEKAPDVQAELQEHLEQKEQVESMQQEQKLSQAETEKELEAGASLAAKAAEKPVKKPKGGQEACRVDIVGGYVKGLYAYTPPIDGKSRWFSVKDLMSVASKDWGIEIVAPEAALVRRGILGYEKLAS